MIREAIILSGGLGTRLRDTVPGIPKCMAPVAGRPFLSYIIDSLQVQGFNRLIFSLGYQSGIIENYLAAQYPTLNYVASVEQTPLGTGGGTCLALQQSITDHVLVVNGDTFFDIDLAALVSFHQASHAACTIALKSMKRVDRYDVVEIDEASRIKSFLEKQQYDECLINGGVYVISKKEFFLLELPTAFSFEKDYLEKFYKTELIYGFVQDAYFIDIGIPQDYRRASRDLAKPPLDLKLVDKMWTLFLDRDGVINDERLGEYVLHWGQFIFSKGVLDVLKKLSDVFGRIIIVSNQRGVSKGLMKEETLQSIHSEMQREVEMVNGRIDKIYYCIDKEDKSFFRKPNPGMAFLAKQDFPDIDLARSIMVGNKPSDMRFGQSAGMFTVFVKTTNPMQVFPHPDIDKIYPSLYDFALSLEP